MVETLWDRKAVAREIVIMLQYSWPLVLSAAIYQLQIIILLSFLTFQQPLGGSSVETVGGVGAAIMAINATGYYWIMGLASAQETISTQLFGQGRFVEVGVALQTSVVAISALSSPVAVVWWFLGDLFDRVGLDPGQSEVAGRFARVMIAGLPAMVLSECLRKFLTAQGVMVPMLIVSLAVLPTHIAVLHCLVSELHWGVEGAAVALVIAFWNTTILLAGYIRWSGIWQRSLKNDWTLDCLKEIHVFFRLAVPGAGMLLIEVWSFELTTLFAGILGPVEMATQTALTNTESFFFMIPLAVGTACATRIGTTLGEGNCVDSRRALRVALGISLALVLLLTIIMLKVKRFWVQIFLTEITSQEMFLSVLPLQFFVFMLNAVQAVLSGALRGCGKQLEGFYYNLFAFWGVGIPWSVCLTFALHWGLFGLWNGLSCGLLVQTLIMLRVFGTLDWEAEARSCATRTQHSSRDVAGESSASSLLSRDDSSPSDASKVKSDVRGEDFGTKGLIILPSLCVLTLVLVVHLLPGSKAVVYPGT